MLTDLAGQPKYTNELLTAVWDVQSGQIPEWSMIYNVFGVELQPDGARVTFLDDSCPVPLEVLARVLYKYLWPK